MTPAAIRRLHNMRRDLFPNQTSTTTKEMTDQTITPAA